MSLLLRTDVTSLKFYKNFILAGIGSFLSVIQYDINRLLQKLHVLKGQKIYGIVPCNDKLLIFGGKQYAVIKYIVNNTFELCLEPTICEDWLHSGVWVGEDRVALLTAHNVVQIWNINQNKLNMKYVSMDNSILYSGLLVPLADGVLVFSGTVFSEVLIGCCDYQITPLQNLKGHKGVIFSITCNIEKQIIVTTSDDRSVRIWTVKNTVSHENNTIKFWKNAMISCEHELYGHSARVMSNCITNDFVISIGEDSGIVFWDFDGKLIRRVSHTIASVWSLDANDKFVITGGGDCALMLHPSSVTSKDKSQEVIKLNLDSPKKVAFTARRNIVTINESNDFVYYDVDKKIETHFKLEHESTFKLLGISNCKQLIAVVDMSGKLDIWIENCKRDAFLSKIVDTKLDIGRILSMHWADNRHLAFCSNNGIISIIAANGNSVEVYAHVILPLCKERWLTACAYKNETFIAGDRCGNIHVFVISQNEPIKSFKHIHGRYGPTSIVIQQNCFVTTGRDGTIKYFSLKPLKYLSSKEFDFQWVECFVDKNKQYICGFQERVFVIYDLLLHNKILEIPCGGGHRSWDITQYKHKTEKVLCEYVEFMYLKSSSLYLERYNLNNIVSKPIINGSHSKVINCLKTICKNDAETLFISGGEDTTLRISTNIGTEFKDVLIYKHLSNIRTLKAVMIDENRYILISAGGRAQICVKILSIEDLSIEEITNYMIKGSDKERKGNNSWRNCAVDFNPETRIMDLDVSVNGDEFIVYAGCSDAILRVFQLLTIYPHDFKLIKEIKYHDTCILKTKTVNISNRTVLISCTSRGIISVFDEKTLDKPIFSTMVHSSGINSLAIKVISESRLLIATGGDDNAIHVNILDLGECRVVSTWSSTNSHCSQVTGLVFADEYLISSSIDQRVTMWRVCVAEHVGCEYIQQVYSDVADIQGIDLVQVNGTSIQVCVFGKGLEVLSLEMK
ncbi:unnamed protein product [Leptidea sinapis]|uniref:tRNA (34-2'-O)-methyltransferase regulator WDR6 n=1 Tax=Leptidea sinapis TaxID=189913 RepID=A0A5E4PRV5_9NEOP|nr:unnamed protein product [Leptidea sinapis]